MGFIHTLAKVTGTQRRDAHVELINGATAAGEYRFFNSGVGLRQELDKAKLVFEAAGEGVGDFFKQGPKFNPTHLNLPANCLSQGPHGHPGGEFSYVIDGGYFDADMEGRVIREYPTGSVVFYAQWSTHRPLSRDGADILYLPFDGIVFGKDAADLAKKMFKIGTKEEALEYALMWMIPDAAERQRLMGELTQQISQ